MTEHASAGPRLRVLLVSHRDFFERDGRPAFLRAFADRVQLSFVAWEDGPTDEPVVSDFARLAGVDPAELDACVTFVRFALRQRGAAFRWTGFEGLRVWLETDAWTNYQIGRNARWRGTYPPVFHRNRYDVMVCTGKEVTARLRQEGVNAYWLPKGYDEKTFKDLRLARRGLCTFGTSWPSRRALAHKLTRAGIRLDDVSGPYEQVARRLNYYDAAIVCNMRSAVPLGKPGRLLHRTWPQFVRLAPGIEPMIKTFEVAGAGCAPVVDWIDELDDLGFVDGKTCLVYRDFDEAIDQLRAVESDELRLIGRNAHELVARRHTWTHRAAEFERLLATLTTRVRNAGRRPA